MVTRPWWKKLLPSRGPKVVPTASGQRATVGRRFEPGVVLRKTYRKVRIVAGVLILIGGVAYGAVPSIRNGVDKWFDNTKGRVQSEIRPTYVPIHAVSATANMNIAGHPGGLAIDELTNTYWLAPWNPDKVPALTLDFGHKVTLKEMILYSGVAANYVAFGRPSKLHLVYSNGTSSNVTPDDTDKPQTLPISGANGITSVEIQIAGVYPGNKGSNVATTEIEVFALKV